MDRRQREGFLMLLVGALGYAFLPTLAKLVYRTSDLGALDIMFWRFTFAAPVVWALVLLVARHQAATLARARVFGTGLIFSMAALSAFMALARLPASVYTVLVYTYPAMVALGAVALGEPLTPAAWLALVLTITGVVLTVPDVFADVSQLDTLGVALSLFNAVVYAAYILLSSVILRGQSAMLPATAWSITGSLSVAVVLVFVRGLHTPHALDAWAALLGLAVVSTVLPILLFYSGMQRLGAAKASILSTSEPVFALGLAALLLGERLQVVQIVGAAFIFSSVLLLQLQQLARTAVSGQKPQ